MSSTTIAAPTTERVAAQRLPMAALIGAIIGAIANVVVLLIGQAIAAPLEIVMDANSPAVPLGIVSVVMASAVPAIGAALLLWVLGRFTRRPITIFLGIAAVFLLLSLGGPLSMPVPVATKLVLSVMHVVAGAAIAGALVTQARQP